MHEAFPELSRVAAVIEYYSSVESRGVFCPTRKSYRRYTHSLKNATRSMDDHGSKVQNKFIVKTPLKYIVQSHRAVVSTIYFVSSVVY